VKATALFSLVFCIAVGSADAANRTLKPFASEAELQAAFKAWTDAQPRIVPRRKGSITLFDIGSTQAGADTVLGPAAASVPPPAHAPSASPAPMVASAAPIVNASESKALARDASQESITNVQHVGVDEGGIVKHWGDYLVVLRRGRLFTVNVGARSMKPVSTINAYGAGIDGRGAWYDEMLIHGNSIVVIGFSYERGGTEIGLFDIDSRGELRYKATHYLRSNDYFSSRNYASRLIGSKLVFYTPLAMNAHAPNLDNQLPGARDHHDTNFRRIAPAGRIYSVAQKFEDQDTLHSITVCDLAKPAFACESTAVLAPRSRAFYVSTNHVYVWTNAPRRVRMAPANERAAYLFRLPLDGRAPSMLHARGGPIDQLSFNEQSDGTLNVLLRANSRGEAMWGSDAHTSSAFSLLRVKPDMFGDDRERAPESAYTPLPDLPRGSVQNRYVGDYLIYGLSARWVAIRGLDSYAAIAVRYKTPQKNWPLSLPHAVERIEALGSNALVVGQSGDGRRALSMTTLLLASAPDVTHRFEIADAVQAESRTHGFFYKPDDAAHGTLGLPIVRDASASIVFVNNHALTLKPLGTLDSGKDKRIKSDGCVASCVDWYGNARPIFLRGRIFALMGYEIVEGRISGGAISEIQRTNFFQPTMSIAP
jgi:hypothetical protein